MGLPEFSTRRPVTTIMIFAGVMLFGFISVMKLPQELFPPITYPQLTVFTEYANAAPEEIETLLTKPVEEAVGTVSGLKRIRSISKEGISLVIGEFDWDQNMDFASLRTREKVDLIKARLPRDASEPLVVPFNPFELPVMTISVTGERSPVQLRQIAVDTIKNEMEKIDGVASATVEGGLEREILVEVNQGKLKSYGVSILDISSAITNANLNYPAGTIKESFYEYLIRTLGEFKEAREIEDVVVKNMADGIEDNTSFEDKLKERKISPEVDIVLVKNVAVVKDVFKERSSFSRFNGEENVSISIQKQAQANTTQVINRVRSSFRRINKILPEDIKLEIIYDQSIFIKDAIDGVRNAALQGGVLALLVLLIFLRSFRSAAIVTLSIPISIMIVFTFMHFGNLSINMMSLGGLALGVGMLVDNAIVVMENIFRHKQQGKPAVKAAIEGAEEVSNAIVASTLTTIAVFLPMIFVVGIAGQLFKELAFTVTFSLVGSLWVALTLIPLLSCKAEKKSPRSEVPVSCEGPRRGPARGWVSEKYEFILRKFLRYKWIGLSVILMIFISSLFLFNYLEKELMPKTDQGQFLIKIDMPVGTKLEGTNENVFKMGKMVQNLPYVESVSSIVGSTKGESAKDIVKRMGSHQGQIIVNLKEKRKIKTTDVVQALKREFSKDRELRIAKIEFSLQQGIISGAFGEGGKPVTIEIKGESLNVMEKITRDIESELKKIEGIFGIEDDVPEPAPEVRVNVEKDKASLFNISVVDLARTAQMVLRGAVSSQFKEKGHEIDIRVRLREEDRDSYDKLYRIQLNSPGGGIIPLGSVVKFDRGKGPSEIKRLSQERTIVVSASIIGRKISEVLTEVDKAIAGLNFESGYAAKLTGESEEMKKSFNSLRFALILSLVLVYMIMAAQFESLSQPLIILFTVPLSLIGVLLALFVTNTSLSVVAFLGIIMLGGIVVNNGIVLIDYTNILMQKGSSAVDAVVEASLARLRPIVMTALTTVLGLMPMALAFGRGAELRAPMAISVMGGLMVSTFLTLVVIPSIFVLEHEMLGRIKKIFS
ncbi:MAG: efflux RND transporter permease subunit [Candidatus Omnitrophota bacterium]